MINNQVISGLLCVIANITHPESQKNAAQTLIVYIILIIIKNYNLIDFIMIN